MARWVYRTQDGLISHKSQYSDAVKTGTLYATVDIPDNIPVDTQHQRIDSVNKQLRSATQAEKDAIVTELVTIQINNDKYKEDVLTTLAYIIRREMGPAAFDALTPVQKRNLILQQA